MIAPMDEQAFLKRLLATFRVEAGEHLRALSAALIELEQAASEEHRRHLVETVFRETHSLKGAARAVGKDEIEVLCGAGEAVFSALKRGKIPVTPALLDLLHTALGTLERLLRDIDGEVDAATRAAAATVQAALEAAASGEPSPAPPITAGFGSAAGRTQDAVKAPAPPPAGDERSWSAAASPGTVRVPVRRLDAALFQAESLLAAKLAGDQRLLVVRETLAVFESRRREWLKVAPEIRLLQRAVARIERGGLELAPRAALALGRLLEHSAGDEAFMASFEARMSDLAGIVERGIDGLGGQVVALLDSVKQLLMLPMASVIEPLPKLVRDLSRQQGKEVDFRVSGGEIEIDRRILDELRDPLIHLLRNGVDHGIERPEVREAAGKPRRGRLTLTASQIGSGRMELVIADDGAGVDLARLRAAASTLGLASAAAAEEGLSLVFQSGLSTSPRVTDISGRGLGLAIVREKVERLGGSVSIESSAGTGTVFRMVLPLTLATFRGVRVRLGGEEAIFPITGLERVLRIRREEIATLEHREMVRLDGQAIALVRLARLLELPSGDEALPATVVVVVAVSGDSRIAFAVDEVVGEQEVLVKSLGRQLRRVRNIAGASVLGSGRIVPVLYLPDLFLSARRTAAAPPRLAPEQRAPVARSVLVAEDSVTSRTLLKGVLESAGYRVETAVDGADAFTRLRTEAFDLLVSDVEMPRMDGFELTARVRADRKLARMPVVLVTALESRDDRERGADAGADAYIVKSTFDQANLLATIRRLL